MPYVDKRLFEEETIRYRGEFHWLIKVRAMMALIFLGIIIVGILLFLRDIIRINTTEFVVTSRRLLFKKGVFSAKVSSLSLSAIEGAEIRQGFFGRIFGFGDLVIEGRGEGEIKFPTMAEPGRFLAAAEAARQAAEDEPVDKIADAVDDAA